MQKIYNSQTQKKEVFETLSPQEVKMYVCGPTVYGLLHVGNFRGPVFFNLVRNWLERSGYKVTFVYNYTDVDDKIIQKALAEGTSSHEVSERYITEFQRDFAALGLKSHSHNPKVTEFIPQIVDFVADLVKKGAAYTVAGEGGSQDVVFSIDGFADYGKLSGRKPEDLIAGSRVDVNEKKKNPLDFVLWKSSKPGEPSWASPWGAGRPGWHIECSAMIRCLLGDQIDIHGGGSDLIFPHHENEIAQSEAVTGKPFVRYWMHNNMLTFGSQKMSKSLGNIRSLRDFLSEYPAEVYKYMILSVHYRSLLDFSEEAILRSLTGLGRIYSAMSFAESLVSEPDVGDGDDPQFASFLAGLSQGAREALQDDFNTPEVMARVFEAVRQFNTVARGTGPRSPAQRAVARQFLNWLRDWGQLMSVLGEPPHAFLMSVDDLLLAKKGLSRDQVQGLVEERNRARASKQFKAADILRDQLAGMGVLLFDSPQGTRWEMAK